MNKLPLILITLLFLSCGNMNSSELSKMGADFEDLSIDQVSTTRQTSSPQQPDPNSNAEITRKLIKTGGIDFQSLDIEKDINKIKKTLSQYKAYVENENQSKSNYRISHSLKIRVPFVAYDSLFSNVVGIAEKVDSKYSNVEDVTSKYFDLQTRIKNKKALEKRYIDLLKKANSIKDILEIEKSISVLRASIEILEGEFKYMSKQISYSTINVSLYEVLPYEYDSRVRKGFGAQLLNALDDGWQAFLSFLIGTISVWPFILFIILGIYLSKKLIKKIRKNK